MAQEHWLSDKQLPLLQQLGTQFVARSGMEDAVSSGILTGRPFGGVSISWSSDLDHAITPISNFCHKRVVGIEMKAAEKDILFLCVYMPFYNSNNRSQCMTETLDALTMLENIINHHPNHHVIIGGDINSELKDNSPFDPMWTNFMSDHQLICCDASFPPSSVTYHHISLGHKKWNDHFIVSQSLVDESRLANFAILQDGDNLSDHYPIMMSVQAGIQTKEFVQPTAPLPPTLIWSKLKAEALNGYTSRLQQYVNQSPSVLPSCNSQCICKNHSCTQSLQEEYDYLISCLKRADSSLPRFKPGVQKDWWTADLTELRNQSIEIHSLWVNEGRPHQGPTHEERLRVRASYKRAIRSAQRAPKQAAWDRLHSSLIDHDTNDFWKTWRQLYNKNKSQLSPVVNGCSSGEAIATSFMHSFHSNSTPNNQHRVDRLNDAFSTAYDEYVSNHSESCDCGNRNITLNTVVDALLCMRDGKSCDEDGISAEHLHNAPLNMLQRLTTLFNQMLKHSFVPRQFRLGFMVPIVKNHHGNLTDLNNYRGITISPVLSKLFEHILKLNFKDFLSTSDNQFGFKKNNSTVHALHCLRETVDYHINKGSRVFCAFLDASKAFDRLVHSGLFLKLIERRVPLMFLNIIITWYNGLQCRVKWGNHFSDWFSISAGVRQGGVLSPDFYSIYVDDLILKLKASHKGCYFANLFAAALFYADDMAILAPSVKGLQSLLLICEEYCLQWDIGLNPKKSKCLYFGKKTEITYKPLLNGKEVTWADEWVYLGVPLKSGKRFSCSVNDKIRKFYRCVNAILRIDGFSNEMIMLQLVETHCVPILTYAIEVIHVLDRDERRQLRVAYNSIFRKIFEYRRYESVTALQTFLNRPTWEQLTESRRNGFVNRIRNTGLANLSLALLT